VATLTIVDGSNSASTPAARDSASSPRLCVLLIEASKQVCQVDGVLAVEHETQRRQFPGGEGFARCLQQDISALLQAALGQSVVRGLVCGFGHGRILDRRGVGVGRSNIGAVAGPASTS
jgi:hypothetical protein